MDVFYFHKGKNGTFKKNAYCSHDYVAAWKAHGRSKQQAPCKWVITEDLLSLFLLT